MMAAVKLDLLLSDDSILVDTASDSCLVVHRRNDQKIGYILPTLGDSAEVEWTNLDHGQNVLCHARKFIFGFDISSKSTYVFRVANLQTQEVFYDAPISEKTLAVHITPENALFYSTVEGEVCYWNEGLKFSHKPPEKDQAVSLEYCDPDKGILALTNDTIYLVNGTNGILLNLKIPVSDFVSLCSSIGQSVGLLIQMLWVQVPPEVLFFNLFVF